MPQDLASIDRLVGMRLRADLLVSEVELSGATTWIVKDPLTAEHFQFSAEEYALMDWMRERVTIAKLQRRFNRRFSPRTIRPEVIWEFLSRLHSSGLTISDSAGQGSELLQRHNREMTRRVAYSWTSLLGIRFRGIDPDRFLTAVRNDFRWLFTPLALLPVLALLIYALSLVVGHFEEFRDRLPELSAFVDPRNLVWLLLAIGVVKVLHEFGHAMACKYFGGEVHEMGFMLLVFSPCLYCDVSDAWRFPSKWQRIAVSAAGMLVELMLASAATIIWWYAQPGVVQLVALNIMIICTVNTLLINGNPLMRYDGYYIFSDLMETPNLFQRSREAFRHFWSDWLLGQPTDDDPLIPAGKRSWLAAYAICSKVYMVVIGVTIVWGLVKVLHPYHLENLAYAVGLTVFGGALVSPVSAAVELVRNPVRRAEVRTGRLSLLVAIGLAAVVAVLAIPVDYNVRAPLVIMPADASRIYATAGGTLVNILPAGSQVHRGDVIGQLQDTGADMEIARLEGELKLRKLHLDHLERLRGVDKEANDQLPTARTAVADSQHRLDERRDEASRLTLIAPRDGVIIPAPRKQLNHKDETRLPMWSGSLLDPKSVGAHVEPGTLVCLVGDPQKLTAVLLVDDTDIKRLEPGQKTRLRIDELPGQVVEGEVVEVARHELDDIENLKMRQADLSPLLAGLVAPERSGAQYEVRVRFRSEERGTRSESTNNTSLLDPRFSSLIIGGRGDAKVSAERITIGRRIYRYLAQTFRLPM
jgi:putative peptide zinc metalloprotease protein